MKKIIIYHKYVPKLGGVETAVYNLAKGLDKNGYDVTLVYETAESSSTLFNYAKVSTVKKLQTGDEIKCDVLLVASNHLVPEGIKAKKILQWIHSDYDKYQIELTNKDKNVEYVAVSKWASSVIKKREGVESKVVYNLVDEEFGTDNRPRLKLVTNSRVSHEKGFERMLILAQCLKEAGVKFKWVVYGDNSRNPDQYWDCVKKFKDIPEVQWVGYKEDVVIGLEEADYLVQLSDWEGCPYSVLEALKMEVPCIVTSWGGVEELIKDTKNGFILPMETETYGQYIDLIVNYKPKFKYEPLSTIDEWIKIIEEKK